MKKNKFAKHWLMLFCGIFPLLWFCGCGTTVEYKNAACFNKFQKDRTIISSDKQEHTRLELLGGSSEKCIFLENILVAEENGTATNQFEYYIYDFATTEKETIPVEQTLTTEAAAGASIRSNGNIYVWNYQDVFQYDSKFTLLNKIGYSQMLPPSADDKKEKGGIIGVWCGDRYVYSLIHVHQCERLVVLDDNAQVVFCEEVPSVGSFTVFQNETGEPLFWDNVDCQFYQYDENENDLVKVGKQDESKEEEYYDSCNSLGDSQYDFYYYRFDGMPEDVKENSHCLIGVKKGKSYRIFDFATMGIGIDRVTGTGAVFSDNSGGFNVIYPTKDESCLVVEKLLPCDEMMDYSLKKNKKIIHMGCMQLPDKYSFVINDFNLDSQEYYVEVTEYLEKYEDYNTALSHMNLDLTNGYNIDLLCVNGYDSGELTEKGAFHDLNEYFEQSKEVSKEDFIDSFIHIVTDEHGKINLLYPSFMLTGFAYPDKIDFRHLEDYSGLVSKDKLFFGNADTVDLLTELLRYSGDCYVDINNEEACLKREEFGSLLNLLKAQSESFVEENEAAIMLCKGNASAVRAEILYPYWYFYYEDIFGGDIQISTPGSDGPVVWELSSSLGVLEKSQNKEGSYAFLDYLFSPIVYDENFSYDGFPVLKLFWDNWERKILAKENYCDMFGNNHVVFDRQLGDGEAARVIEAGSLTKEDVERMRNVVEQATYIEPMKSELINIIVEESQYYLSNQRDLENTFDAIEHRMKMAISE